jgi:hypothetical protein
MAVTASMQMPPQESQMGLGMAFGSPKGGPTYAEKKPRLLLCARNKWKFMGWCGGPSISLYSSSLRTLIL